MLLTSLAPSPTPTATAIATTTGSGTADPTIVFLPYVQLLLSNTVVDYLLVIPLALIVLDVITGVMAALRMQRFDMKELSRFLSGDLLRYMGAFFVVFLTWLTRGTYTAATVAATLGMGTLSLAVSKSLVENIHELLAGYPLQALAEQAAKELGQAAAQAQAPPPQVVRDSTPPPPAPVLPMTDPLSYQGGIRTATMPSVQAEQAQVGRPTVPLPATYAPSYYVTPSPSRSDFHETETYKGPAFPTPPATRDEGWLR